MNSQNQRKKNQKLQNNRIKVDPATQEIDEIMKINHANVKKLTKKERQKLETSEHTSNEMKLRCCT